MAPHQQRLISPAADAMSWPRHDDDSSVPNDPKTEASMRLARSLTSLPSSLKGGAVAIGNFDGVHLGHRVVIGQVVQAAAALGGVPVVVLTFEPHPRALFRPDEPPFRITPLREKLLALADTGIDGVLLLRFTRVFAGATADSFVDDVLINGLGARHVVVGHDFCLGRERAGNAAYLNRRGAEAGFRVTAVPAQRCEDGEPYSSTRIRDYLLRGEPQHAARLLGRPFRISGRVRQGDQRGRTIGFPTANLALGPYLRACAGVYAIRATTEAGQTLAGVANLGWRPTFQGQDLRLETHLFDFAGNLYGQHLTVDLLHFIRPEMKFSGLPALLDQITKDAETARTLSGIEYRP